MMLRFLMYVVPLAVFDLSDANDDTVFPVMQRREREVEVEKIIRLRNCGVNKLRSYNATLLSRLCHVTYITSCIECGVADMRFPSVSHF